MKYTVSLYQDDIYEVLDEYFESLFKGTLSDCEAWIRLKEMDNVNF